MPAESTSPPAVDNPYEGTIPALGASGSFSRPAGSAESDRGRPAWLVPVAAAVALVLLALVVLLLS